MKNLIALTIFSTMMTTASAAFAQPGGPSAPDPIAPALVPDDCCPEPMAALPPVAEPETVATTTAPSHDIADQPADDGWRPPPGRRLLHGFRIGYNYVMNYDKPNRADGTSVKDFVGMETPHSMLLGYEAFYRVTGHSWLNILLVGNVTIAGLEQSKFIPAASGLIGAEFNQSFQLGIGVNLTPDPEAPSHMIAAAGWTPSVGSIQTPVHFYVVPDTNSNHRMGATVGVTW